jgi:hypothetical protein
MTDESDEFYQHRDNYRPIRQLHKWCRRDGETTRTDARINVQIPIRYSIQVHCAFASLLIGPKNTTCIFGMCVSVSATQIAEPPLLTNFTALQICWSLQVKAGIVALPHCPVLMDQPSSLALCGAIFCTALGLCCVYRNAASGRGMNLPPGPPSDTIIGHLRSIPPQYQEKTFAEWGKTYGQFRPLLTSIFRLLQ